LTHNLRTPLTAIKAAVTALLRSGPWQPQSELTSEGRRELLQVIDEESDRLNRFIEGLSTSDRAEPAQPVHLRAVQADDLVRAGLARAETVTRDHRVAVAVADNLPRVSVDEASIVEVIYILLDNASKYAPAGSAITVRANPDGDRHVRFTVIDEGPGIPAEHREHVFEKFFRIPGRQSHDPRRGGVGLGLPIARRLVEAQAGWIWVDAVDGRGTSISMTLPVAVEVPDAERPAPAALATR
jgi:two-component system, OmpR family, sensor histidine kinase KdpD